MPKKVLEIGKKKLKSAAVAQFLGEVPPARVIRSMANRLWGFEGEVIFSELSPGFFLFEFHSEALCNWVLERSWHIHHSAMVLRRWSYGITPIDFSPKELPVWIVMKRVPPILINPEGVSWLATQVGRPINKFVRDGLDVKICVVKDVHEEVKSELVVELEDEQIVTIPIEVPQIRQYKSVGAKRWERAAVQPQVKVSMNDPSSSGNAPEQPKGKEGAPEPEVISLPGGGKGNASKPSLEGEDAPFQRKAGVQSGRSILSPMNTDKDGILVSDAESSENENEVNAQEEADVQEASLKQVAPAKFRDLFAPGLIVSPKGIVTRNKHNRRR
ncbi:hypothetical protein LINPERPRIM_LOCUS25171 [Linum perenne]